MAGTNIFPLFKHKYKNISREKVGKKFTLERVHWSIATELL